MLNGRRTQGTINQVWGFALALVLFACPAHANHSLSPTRDIINQASAEFDDGVTGGHFRLVSLAVRTVQLSVGQASLTQDIDRVVKAGAVVDLPHVLNNFSPGSGVFLIGFQNLPGDDGDLQNVHIFIDLNGNGKVDPGEPEYLPGTPITLASGEALKLVVQGKVSADLLPGKQVKVQVTASTVDHSVNLAVNDTLRVSPPSIFQVSKVPSTLSPRRGEEVTFNFAVSNTDGVPDPILVAIDGALSKRFVLRDTLPANTTFTRFLPGGSGQPLCHLIGTPLHSYMTMVPSDLSQIDAVAFAFEFAEPGS